MIDQKIKKTILVVDDTPENLTLVTSILIPEYQVKAAINGKIALKIAATQTPDLILLDIMMPEMDGYEVCRQLKKDSATSHIPIIFLTAMDQTMDEEKGLNLGAVDYITKPVRSSILMARVHTHLALRDQNLALEVQVNKRTDELNKLNLKLRQSNLEVIRRLGRASSFKDNETGNHVIRVGHYARLLSEKVGFNEEQQGMIECAAQMHDIGKIGIPDNILLKQGPLNGEEWDVMRKHPEIGAEIIGDDDSELLNMSRNIALSHHECWDGSGYPFGLVGNKIPIEGRIASLADVFDALIMVRPYKPAWSVEDAVDQLRKLSGSKFDPELVTRFIDILPEIVKIKEQYVDSSDL